MIGFKCKNLHSKRKKEVFTWVRIAPVSRCREIVIGIVRAGTMWCALNFMNRSWNVSRRTRDQVSRGLFSCINIGQYYFSLRQLKKQDLLQGGETIYLCFASIPAATPKLLHPQPWTGLGIHGLAVGRGMHLWWTIGTLYLHKYRTLLYFSKTIMNKLEDCSYVCWSYLIHSQHHWTL